MHYSRKQQWRQDSPGSLSLSSPAAAAHIVRQRNTGFLVDRYGNKSFTTIEAVFYGMSHLRREGREPAPCARTG